MKLKLLLGITVAGLGLFAVATPALAYNVGPGSTCTSSASNPQGGTPFTVTCTFVDTLGAPIAGVSVTFTATGPSAGTIFTPATALTDVNGVVSTTVTLPANSAGTFALTGTLASGQGAVSVSVTEAGGFPNTAAAAVKEPVGAYGALALGGLLVLVAIGGLAINRRRQSRSAPA